MNALLTAQQVQELIQVDKSTVYRMAEDGRLPGIKVGRQWRFPAEQIIDQFGLDAAEIAPTSSISPGATIVAPGETPALDRLLSPETLQSTAELLSEIFGLMSVITDMSGRPLTTVVNPCGFYRAISDRPETEAACLNGWKELADRPNIAPRFTPSHLQFLCARTFVWVDRIPIGMVVVGGATPDQWPPSRERLEAIADELGLPLDVVEGHVLETWDLTPDQRRWVLRILPEVVELVSLLASARSQLLVKGGSSASLANQPEPRGGGPS